MLERLKMLRKTLKLSQNQFSQKINFGQSSYANIENGTRNLTDRTIQLICNEFGVNEKWLRTGEGEMFNQKSNNLLDEIVKEYDLNTPLQKRAMELFLKSAPAQRQATLEAIRRFSQSLEDENSIYNQDIKPPADVGEVLKKYLMLSETAQVEVRNFIDYKYEQERGLGEESSEEVISS